VIPWRFTLFFHFFFRWQIRPSGMAFTEKWKSCPKPHVTVKCRLTGRGLENSGKRVAFFDFQLLCPTSVLPTLKTCQ
jgi:hypothetical protein